MTAGRAVTAEDLAKLSEAVRQGITDGHIGVSIDDVTISEKASPTGKAGAREYTRCDALDAQGMAILCGGKMKPSTPKPAEGDDTRSDADKAPGAADYFNYGYDLDVRSTVRAQLLSEMEGPEKAVKKTVQALVAAEYDRATIVSMVQNSPKFKGVDGLDKMIESAFKA